MSELTSLMTPACIIDMGKFQRNISCMQAVAERDGLVLRPHVKTLKSLAAAERYALSNGPITVSTLAEAEYFAAAGYRDILYAVGLVPNKYSRVQALSERAEKFTVVLDSLAAVNALVSFAKSLEHPLQVMLEIDVDDHRAGLLPMSDELLECAKALKATPQLHFRGIMTHAGGSYDCYTEQTRDAMAEQECALIAKAAARLAANHIHCELVSAGSTPTALANTHHKGINELRAGVYATFDCVMAGLGVCDTDDIAMSVLTSVIGHQTDKNWVIVDAGWMALSRDQGTATHAKNCGYGLVCDQQGRLLEGWYVSSTNQEHGIISHIDGKKPDDAIFAYGNMLRILPIHACATAAQFSAYQVIDEDGKVTETWSRITGW